MLRAAFLIMVVQLLIACSSAPHRQVETYSKNDADEAIKEILGCAKEHVPEVDDGVSDAESIALGLSLRCSVEYTRGMKVFALSTLENNDQVRMFIRESNTREKKIEMFLPTVFQYRAYVRSNKP